MSVFVTPICAVFGRSAPIGGYIYPKRLHRVVLSTGAIKSISNNSSSYTASRGIIDGRIRASLERIVARWNAHSASLKYADLPLNTDYREVTKHSAVRGRCL